jgi:U3 small nucleolar RNA-associated protein 14
MEKIGVWVELFRRVEVASPFPTSSPALVCYKMARQGRQPKQLSTSTQRKPKQPPQPKPSATSSAAPSASTTAADSLDTYSYQARVKRPRGDVDPEARAKPKRGKGAAAAASKGKGKGKAREDGSDEEEEDEDLSDDDGFRVYGDEVVEFTGRKPKGFKLGMDSDAEEGRGFGSDFEDEEIDSDLASGSEDELPGQNASGSKGKKAAKVRFSRFFPSFPC